MLIVVEGCIGAGKSTVANGLASYRKSAAIFENFESNPFLPAFYKDPAANATETEFAFLLLHFHQLRSHADAISNGECIADFHLGKDLIYADLNLSDSSELQIFKDLYTLLYKRVPNPDLLVYLSASTDLLVERIRRRKRDIELQINPKYYARVSTAYEDFFASYEGRKLRISMDECDFLQTPELYRTLSLSVDKQLRSK